MPLIDTIYEAERFSKHPIKESDLDITGDLFIFYTLYCDFIIFLRGLVASNPESYSTMAYVNGLYWDCLMKIKVYEIARGKHLLDSQRYRVSPFNELYSHEPPQSYGRYYSQC